LAEKILVPVDGSERMARTVKFACDLVKILGGTLTLIHVVILRNTPSNIPIDPAPFEEAGKSILESAQKLVEQNGCKADTILEMGIGNAGHKIVTVAQAKGFTLIVIHARGHSRVATLLIGSVCDAVAHNSPCPVLIVRP
jgi:nucleotide-binding universal stress UspA family protein